MERHINSECSVTTGKARSSVPRCARARCGKVLYSPIRCEVRSTNLILSQSKIYGCFSKSCRQLFCAQHRFPADHSCASHGAQTTPKQASKPASAAGAAAMAAIKRSLNQSSTSSPKSAASAPAHAIVTSKSVPPVKGAPSPVASSSKTNPFSKTDW